MQAWKPHPFHSSLSFSASVRASGGLTPVRGLVGVSCPTWGGCFVSVTLIHHLLFKVNDSGMNTFSAPSCLSFPVIQCEASHCLNSLIHTDKMHLGSSATLWDTIQAQELPMNLLFHSYSSCIYYSFMVENFLNNIFPTHRWMEMDRTFWVSINKWIILLMQDW